jgi:hypothetical protein
MSAGPIIKSLTAHLDLSSPRAYAFQRFRNECFCDYSEIEIMPHNRKPLAVGLGFNTAIHRLDAAIDQSKVRGGTLS